MKKLICLTVLIGIFSSCKNYYSGELTGVQGRKKYFEPEPFGMVFVPQGSFNMGPSDQDVAWAQNKFTKTVTVEPFYMDETEITNNEYRQFVYWVKDSIIRTLLGQQFDEFIITETGDGEPLETPRINWEEKIDWDNPDVRAAVEPIYYAPEERFFGRMEINVHKLNYRYFWVDLQQAAKNANRFQNNFDEDIDNTPGTYEGTVYDIDGNANPINNRGDFIMRDIVNVYPDTLCWIRDFTYSYNEPLATMYFWHPSYDNYPVVGVSWKQANAFCTWRTMLLNTALARDGQPFVQDYRLPTETEWEYAARGDLQQSMYPWGGPYTRNLDGCLLANFKPMRGNYADDGGVTTIRVGTYEPNEYGLYDMAGNVSEWTANAYDESAYFFWHDLNPDYKYNARPQDSDVMKRKVIRGGSWKDIAYYLQVSSRDYEYQDSTKSFIGFRCIRSYLGNN